MNKIIFKMCINIYNTKFSFSFSYFWFKGEGRLLRPHAEFQRFQRRTNLRSSVETLIGQDMVLSQGGINHVTNRSTPKCPSVPYNTLHVFLIEKPSIPLHLRCA